MTAIRQLDRKVQVVLGVAAALMVAAPVYGVWDYVASVKQSHRYVASADRTDEHLVSLGNGATMLLDRGSVGQRMVRWLKMGTDEPTAFEIADTDFVAGSAEPTREGLNHIVQIAQVLKADPRLQAELIVRDDAAADPDAMQLEQSRASRMDKELLGQRLSPDSVKLIVEPVHELAAKYVLDHPSQDSQLFVVLSR